MCTRKYYTFRHFVGPRPIAERAAIERVTREKAKAGLHSMLAAGQGRIEFPAQAEGKERTDQAKAKMEGKAKEKVAAKEKVVAKARL